jgi:glycerate dehydrogenase
MADQTPRIVFLDRSTLDRGDIDFSPIEALGELVSFDHTAPGERLERVAGATILLTNKVLVDEAAMEAAPGLRLIQVAATGTNNVDLRAAAARGVAVGNVAGYSTPSVAQHTMTLILNLATGIHAYAREAQLWPRSPHFTRLDHPIFELAGRTLGIVGLGTIGSEVGRLAAAFGMEVIALAREGASGLSAPGAVPRVGEAEFFARADFVTLHCPLTEANRHCIGEKTIARMKPGAFLVNTGRGPLVDETALAAALRSGRLGGAALDVLSAEPPPADHPLLAPDIPNLILTPHTAWASVESRRRLTDGIAANVRAFLAGDPMPWRVA